MTTYYSTNRQVADVDLAEALLQGQAADKGLFMPRTVPKLSPAIFERGREMSYSELAIEVLAPYAEGVFSRDVLTEICESAYNFEVPLEHVTGGRHVMRLDRGPTASFKDFAARFMGRALGRLVRERRRELIILTATSGDTGSAVANAFLGVDGIRVLVLFPLDEVSNRQRKQMTTLGDNIATVAVHGKFDDCQAMVKRAFADPALSSLDLSSANSINIGRLLPQSVYYVYAASRLIDLSAHEPIVFSVPSGNFGDLMGGVLAYRSGLPVRRFIVATNANDEVPRFLSTNSYEKIVPSKTCISNAMNVGHPSNLARLVDVYGGQMDEQGHVLSPPRMEELSQDFFATSVDDAATRETIVQAFRAHSILLEPHGAVGWAGLSRAVERFGEEGTSVSLETAHPAKFPDEIRALTGVDPDAPPSLEGLDDLEEHYGEMDVDYDAFSDLLLKEYAT